ncbi:MAG: hypothetical protein SAJ37_22565 [Oscillatoria sp. PMC 1068.18]|nr:hypothetical protein [Oscillatoria sp. PMC 1068.18]
MIKKNLKSVLERQGNLNISLGEKGNINSNLIGCLNMGSEQPLATKNGSQSQTTNFQGIDRQNHRETIVKLR